MSVPSSVYWSKPPNAYIWLFPQYVTEALTRHAGLCPQVLAIFGLYPSLLHRRPLTGLTGIWKVMFEEAAEKGVPVKVPEPFVE